MSWPDGLGLWPANAPDTQPDPCDDCYGDGLFCKACDQRKSDCECKLGDIDVDRWLQEVLGADSVELIDPDDASSTFDDESFRFAPCLRCGGYE
jgi:hypothetical protein